MNKIYNHNHGYVGLIMLMITVAIIAFLMMNQYQTLGIVPASNQSIDTNGSITSGSVLNPATPINRAKEANKLLESLDRKNLSQ